MIHTVLLIEDEEELREVMRDALEDDGYTVVAAREGQEALDAIPRIDHVCLVLLDLLMPGMNGWDFLDAVKTRPDFALSRRCCASSPCKPACIDNQFAV